jgi:hypothetical protein
MGCRLGDESGWSKYRLNFQLLDWSQDGGDGGSERVATGGSLEYITIEIVIWLTKKLAR